MNFLAIDYGTKRIGLAVSVLDIIFPIPPLQNTENIFKEIQKVVKEHQIDGVYVGVSEGEMAIASKNFADKLSDVLELKVETIEEAVSTIEADEIYIKNKKKKKDYKKLIDSVAAAVILRRAIG
ncbi:MAG: Holliday junction resolvase RuvX [Candidatus Shapirobacteria bacterium]